VLNKLNASARNSRPTRSRIEIERARPTSIFLCPRPRKILRPELPKVKGAGTANAVVSNQCNGACRLDDRLPSPIRSGRAVVPEFVGSKLRIGVNGSPLCKLRMPENCHPPAIALPNREWLRNGSPVPNGSSYTVLATNLCRTSKFELSRSAAKFSGFCGPGSPTPLSAWLGPLSSEWLWVYARQKSETFAEAAFQLRLESVVICAHKWSVLIDGRNSLYGTPRLDFARARRRQIDVIRMVKVVRTGADIRDLRHQSSRSSRCTLKFHCCT